MRRHISGREAAHMAIESDKRGPVQIEPSPAEEAGSFRPPSTVPEELVPGSGVAASQASKSRKAPPRVRKPSPNHDQCVAPTPDLEAHRGVARQSG